VSVTMVHSNPALIEQGRLRIDRKFHVGMLSYARNIVAPITTLHPLLRPGQSIMDAIEVPLSELPYAVMPFETDASYQLLPSEAARMREQIARSSLVYGSGMGCERIASEFGVPYIMVLEYDLQTQLTMATCDLRSRLRRSVRRARCMSRYVTDCLRPVRRARAVHCNGYPIYEALQSHNENRLLYLDSRMSAAMVMTEDALADRLKQRTNRSLKLLYSGRYERLKGADDSVRVAVECLRRGLDVEMHCYGQGSLRPVMCQLAQEFQSRIQIHDAVPYPELVQISRSFDAFVCCHIQNDPSCTYLEAFGSGLPIVGYANRMWDGLCRASGAGLTSPVGRPGGVADSIQRLADDPQLLRVLSERALQFAREHCFEEEFSKRVQGIRAALESSSLYKSAVPFGAATAAIHSNAERL
jgi:colanic acid/amylovoran biosynthesis glycosyltransferase